MTDSCWLETFTGRKFYPMTPRAEDVCLADIAHALSNQCRFSGHVREFYSVAQHSVLVSQLCPKEFALWGLLHDATEAYLVDLPRPIKHCSELGDFFRAAERRIMDAICATFRLPLEEPPCVKHADNVLLLAERRDLMPDTGSRWELADWGIDVGAMVGAVRIEPWIPERAEAEFLARYKELTQGERWPN